MSETAKKTAKKAAKKEELNTEFTCTSVTRIAWNHEEVVFENDHAKITMAIKNPELHEQYAKGETYDITV